MSWEKPTFEEYEKASGFARFRYKYGLFVVVAAWLCIMYLMYFTITYVDELTTNPLQYAAGEFGLQCTCQNFDKELFYTFNESEVRTSPFYQAKGYESSASYEIDKFAKEVFNITINRTDLTQEVPIKLN